MDKICLIRIKEACVRKFERLARSKLLAISQTNLFCFGPLPYAQLDMSSYTSSVDDDKTLQYSYALLSVEQFCCSPEVDDCKKNFVEHNDHNKFIFSKTRRALKL